MGSRRYVLAATDAGRAKWVQSLARDLDVEPAFVYKERREGRLGVTGVNADVSGCEVVIYDDMIRTGGSLLQAARAYLAAGASRVHAITSHLVLPGDSLEKIRASGAITTLLGTDSHPGSQKIAGAEGTVWSVAPLLVRALERTE
jgi:ribose-phosphate pyrophosphokinase